MDRLSLTAASGMQEFNLPRFQLNNEIANISTPGFKRSFSNISQTLKVSGPGFDSRFAPTNVYKDQVSLAPGAGVPQAQRGQAVGVDVLRRPLQLREGGDGLAAFVAELVVDLEQERLVALHDEGAGAHRTSLGVEDAPDDPGHQRRPLGHAEIGRAHV